MSTRRRVCWLLTWLFLWAWLPQGTAGQNAPARPYVVLVSLDGFRYDYAGRYHAVTLLAIGKEGAAAKGLIPAFPSLTFPNHLSIVTGLYPEHHGIVGNTFYDPGRQKFYDRGQESKDGSWYRGKPLWVVAEEQHVKSACMFWPASEAEILGVRPSYWKAFDRNFPDEQRVAQVLEWLKLPEEQRPHFITMYLGDVDAAGHAHGPESPETREAVQRVDKLVGELWSGMQSLHLPVNLIVVSDHGMQKVEGFVTFGEFADLGKLQIANGGVFSLLYAPDAKTAEETYVALKGKSSQFEVYRRNETPARWHYSSDPRIGDLVVIARGPNMLGPTARKEGAAPMQGEHGFDPSEFPAMNGIFYAVGANVRRGVKLPAFDNVNIFPFIGKILGLQSPAGLDGDERVLAKAYRPSVVKP